MKLIRRALMKVLGAAVIVLVVLYFADQQFAQGHYTDAVQQMAAQMMHSLGTSCEAARSGLPFLFPTGQARQAVDTLATTLGSPLVSPGRAIMSRPI
jgi:hypothetical protein